MRGPYRIGMIGCGFMGRAHSNAWRKVANFFPELARRPVLQAACARDGAKASEFAATWGYGSITPEEMPPHWRAVGTPDAMLATLLAD